MILRWHITEPVPSSTPRPAGRLWTATRQVGRWLSEWLPYFAAVGTVGLPYIPPPDADQPAASSEPDNGQPGSKGGR
jgi:hypothetical protein